MPNEVNVKVSADSTALQSGLAAAKQAVDGFKDKAEDSFKEVGGELTKAFGVAAIVEGIKSLVEEFSKVQDLADKLGTSAESVQRLGVVAKGSGLDTETLTKSLQKATKNAFEAATGNQELADAFAVLGVDAKEFANLAPEDQLKELSEGYEKAGGSAQSLDAISKALGKTGLDLIPILKKGPEALAEEMEAAHVASNDSIKDIKEVSETFERLFGNLKAYGAEALDYLLKRVGALGTGFAAIWAYVSNLTHGLEAASQAYDDVIQAAADLQIEEEKKRADETKKRKPVDTDALEAAKDRAEQEKKDAEELAKLKEQNAKKEEEAHFRSLELLEKQKELVEKIGALQSAKPANALDAERQKGQVLDLQKELETVNKDIARDKEREEKKAEEDKKKRASEALRAEIEERKKQLREAEKEVSELEHHKERSISVDSLRSIGGGLKGVNYNVSHAKEDLQKAQLDALKQSVDLQRQQLELLQAQSKPSLPTYDGSFT